MDQLVLEVLKSAGATTPFVLLLLYALKTIWEAYQRQLAENKAQQDRLMDILRGALKDEEH